MTICSGSGAATDAGATGVAAGGAVKGSGPPAPAGAVSPFATALTTNGSAPFPEPRSRFALFAGGGAEVLCTAVSDDDPLLPAGFKMRGTWYARSAASTTARTTTKIFCRRCFAAILVVLPDPR